MSERPDSQRAAIHGFTMVEVLVVVGIITLLIAILLPALTHVREVARRTVCAARVRELNNLTLVYATESKGRLPDLHNAAQQYIDNPAASGNFRFVSGQFPYYFSLDRRNFLISSYGLGREAFYCPSNFEWSTDALWTYTELGYPGPTASIWGYCYYGGTEWYSVSGKLTPLLVFVPNPNPATSAQSTYDPTVKLPLFGMKQGDGPQYEVVWTDLTRSVSNPIGTPGIFTDNNGSNHVYGAEPAGAVMPKGNGGCNIAYRDGHVEWQPQSSMLRRWFTNGGTAVYRGWW